MSLPSKSYVFTPGHWSRICNFIQDVKQKIALSKLPIQPPLKRAKILDNASASNYDLKAIYEDVRNRIVNWIRKQPDEFHVLTEYKHYKINVRLQSSGYPIVEILCLLKNCNAPMRLSIKKDDHGKHTHILSNWTSHVSNCLKKSKEKRVIQIGISTFFTETPKCAKLIVEQNASLEKEDFQKAPLVKVNQEGQC